MATIRITDLSLRTIIGIHDWERKNKQDIVINVVIDYDAGKACESDDFEDALDYKEVTKRIINKVESSEYYLLEKLTAQLLTIAMDHPSVQKASVRVDKPHALRFAKSVSIELKEERSNE